ncbi:ferredoxin [Gymnopus androsaceus JB14]|uniref:Ferredoxin n=1 Tax=Gymnopus androsaceus JB14 TaxID=1447944 RepID=A0A6A4I9F7_9AGAR|nr:ferredoxin [Gymnopus androsaceus JB14]
MPSPLNFSALTWRCCASIVTYFQNLNGERLATANAHEGQNILDVAHENGIKLEGSCEGKLACSTCHVLLSPNDYRKFPPPNEDEDDMLDMAHGLTDTSRLACQLQVVSYVEGLVVIVPNAFGLRDNVAQK